jgi:hypothetical protein
MRLRLHLANDGGMVVLLLEAAEQAKAHNQQDDREGQTGGRILRRSTLGACLLSSASRDYLRGWSSVLPLDVGLGISRLRPSCRMLPPRPTSAFWLRAPDHRRLRAVRVLGTFSEASCRNVRIAAPIHIWGHAPFPFGRRLLRRRSLDWGRSDFCIR